MTRLSALLLAIFLCFAALPAQAAVTITFWSHELGNSFPHAFFTLRGTPDAGGAPVDANYGFTARSVSPAILFGTVPGRLDIAKRGYMEGSDAQFAVTLTDEQYAAVLALVAAWDEKTGDSHYNLNDRNCVHFVGEAARIAGLSGTDQPKLMKKPRSYLQAVAAANEGRVTLVNLHGDKWFASNPGLSDPVPSTGQATATVPPASASATIPANPAPATPTATATGGQPALVPAGGY